MASRKKPKLTNEQEAALRCDIDRAVTASAGTGKTFVLTNRFVKAIEGMPARLDARAALEAMAAITFTDPAASEMRRKVREEVSKRADAGGPNADRWDQVRDWLFSADIMTIHSFCTQILRENPIEAGVEPGFAIVEGVMEGALVENALEDVFDAATGDDGIREHVRTLLARFDQEGIRDMLMILAHHRVVAVKLMADPNFATPESITKHWKGMVDSEKQGLLDEAMAKPGVHEALEIVVDTLPGTIGKSYEKNVGPALPFVNHLIGRLATNAGLDDSPRLVSALFTGKKYESRTMNGLLGRTYTKDPGKSRLAGALEIIQYAFKEYAERLDAGFGELDEEAARLAHALIRLFSAFRDAYEARKRALGVIDYGDMLEKALVLLEDRDHDSLLEAYRDRYRQMLVDEFQDTDPVQWDIVRRLWGDGEPRPGRDRMRLFIVGDPKQSIYAFRDADVRIFNKAKKGIEKASPLPPDDKGRELSENFRSLKGIVDFVHEVFHRLLTPELYEEFEAEYGKRPATHRKDVATEGTVELIVPPTAEDGDEEEDGACEEELGEELKGAAREFAVVAERIQRLVGEDGAQVIDEDTDLPHPADYDDIAVLLQTRTHLGELQDALDAAGVPFSVYKGVGFYQSQEVRDLASLVAALADRDDAPALYAVLRGPLFDLSDDTLVQATLGRDGSLWKRLDDFASVTGGQDALEARDALDTLDRWRTFMDRLPLHELLRRLLDETGAWATYASLPSGRQHVANIRKLLEQARDFELSGTEGATAFLRLLNEQIRVETKTGEASVGTGSERKAVKIMTVHSAKGLQFPIVVLPTLHREPLAPKGFLLDREIGPGLKAPDTSGEMQSPAALKLIVREKKKRSWAENKRLFYVACTRARDHLILSGLPECLPKGCSGEPLHTKSWLGWLYEAIGKGREDELEDGPYLGGRLRVVRPVPAEADEEERIPPVTTVKDDTTVMEADRVIDPALEPVVLRERVESTSPSRLKEYMNCPAAYRLEKVLKLPRPSPAGRGVPAMALGNVVHAALERCSPGGFDERIVRRQCAAEGIPEGRSRDDVVDEAHRAHESFWTSELGRAVGANPGRVMREQVVLLPLERDDGTTTIVQCKIDLLFKTPDGHWLVVDYKTNKLKVEECEDRMKSAYWLQMALYRIAVGRALGEPPGGIKATIFCTKIGKTVDMGDDASLERALDEAKRALEGIEAGRFEVPDEGDRKDFKCKRCRHKARVGCGQPVTGTETAEEDESDGMDEPKEDMHEGFC